MGGQACVFYGAAEFSRDLDLLVLVDPDNLDRIRAALADLRAEPIAIPLSQPPLDPAILLRGHAFHFRCKRPDVAGLRVDLMANLRRGASFDELWQRRTSFEFEGEVVDVMGRKDLVRVKQTQRDKDWPMVARLVEGMYFAASPAAKDSEIDFLLRELRTPALLIEAATRFPEQARAIASDRPAMQAAIDGDNDKLFLALREEQDEATRQDRIWWEPLKRELEQFRHAK
jgi:hypothetical protein